MESSLQCRWHYQRTRERPQSTKSVFFRANKYLAACILQSLPIWTRKRGAMFAMRLGNRFLAQRNGSQLGRKKQKNGSGAYASASMELFLPRRENDSIDMKVCMCKQVEHFERCLLKGYMYHVPDDQRSY